MHLKYHIFAIILGGLLASASCFAVVSVYSNGVWPKSWPKELEPYRKKARTYGVAHGIHESVHEISFNKREDFEKAWPHILKVKSKGGSVILDISPSTYSVCGSTMGPGIRILASSEGSGTSAAPPSDSEDYADYLCEVNTEMDKVKSGGQCDSDRLIREGKMLRVGPPWPNYIMSADGELPEYVRAKYINGKQKWVPADVGIRARIDIMLVVDGKIIDLNRIPLPENTSIVDKRFSK